MSGQLRKMGRHASSRASGSKNEETFLRASMESPPMVIPSEDHARREPQRGPGNHGFGFGLEHDGLAPIRDLRSWVTERIAATRD